MLDGVGCDDDAAGVLPLLPLLALLPLVPLLLPELGEVAGGKSNSSIALIDLMCRWIAARSTRLFLNIFSKVSIFITNLEAWPITSGWRSPSTIRKVETGPVAVQRHYLGLFFGQNRRVLPELTGCYLCLRAV